MKIEVFYSRSGDKCDGCTRKVLRGQLFLAVTEGGIYEFHHRCFAMKMKERKVWKRGTEQIDEKKIDWNPRLLPEDKEKIELLIREYNSPMFLDLSTVPIRCIKKQSNIQCTVCQQKLGLGDIEAAYDGRLWHLSCLLKQYPETKGSLSKSLQKFTDQKKKAEVEDMLKKFLRKDL